jgi:hypothetical protein
MVRYYAIVRNIFSDRETTTLVEHPISLGQRIGEGIVTGIEPVKELRSQKRKTFLDIVLGR